MDIEHEVNTLLHMHYAGSRDQETRGLLVYLFGLCLRLLTKRCDNFPYECGVYQLAIFEFVFIAYA